MLSSKKYIPLFIFFVILLVALSFASLFLGSEILAPSKVFEALFSTSEKNIEFIVNQIRLPRVLTALLAGSALSVAGLQMQTYFRNGLAGPYILGVSAGSGLGVALLIMTGSLFGIEANGEYSITTAAIVGSVGVMLIMLFFANKIGSGIMLLLIGIMLGSFISASISIMEYFSDADSMKKYVLWTMGSTSGNTLSNVKYIGLFVSIGLAITLFSIRSLNALLMGEDYARSMGISIKKTRLLILISTGILAGIVTAYCGPIAFVGLAVPHVVRLMIKTSNHAIIIPFTALLGAIILVFCDLVATLPGMDIRLPINAVTSIIGAPIVVYIILKNKVTANG